jgi:hypothetical protein
MCFLVFAAKVWRDRVDVRCVELARQVEEFANGTRKISFDRSEKSAAQADIVV